MVSRWVSADPALEDGKYFPKPQDFDTKHDYDWYVENSKVGKLLGFGGVFNPINLNLYNYAGLNPIKFVDPDGNAMVLPNYNFKTHSLSDNLKSKYPDNAVVGFLIDVFKFSPDDAVMVGPASVGNFGKKIGQAFLTRVFKKLFFRIKIKAASSKALKQLVKKLSKPGMTLNQKELGKLKSLIKKYGGKVRTDIKGVKGSGVKTSCACRRIRKTS